MYVFVDESGGLGNEYFVIGMVFCDDPSIAEMGSIVNKHNNHLWANGWPRQLEIKATNLYSYRDKFQEVGAYALKINPRLYLQQIYRDLNTLNIKAGFIIHKPANQGPMLKCLHPEKIYNFLSKQLYQTCFQDLESPLFICVDQRNITLVKKQRRIDRSTQKLNLNYIGYVDHELTFLFARRRNVTPKINIEFGNSRSIKGLQVVDYLCWAIRKKYKGKPFWADLTNNIRKTEKRDNF